MSSERSCLNCSRVGKVRTCARCSSAYYCSRTCQRQHWKTHKKTCGKESPATAATAATVPKHVRELFPSSPGWIQDESALDALLGKFKGSGIPSTLIKQMLGNFRQQKELDFRYRYLMFLYKDAGITDQKIPVATHVQFLETSGWDHSFVQRRFKGQVTRKQILEAFQTHMELAKNYVHPQVSVPKECESCGKECESECICGEPYCSPECQITAWKNHKSICEQVEDNNSIAFQITRMYWANRDAY